MTKSERFVFIFLFLISVFAIWFKSAHFLDPDFGWHLRNGQVIATSGVPSHDLFTYTVPSFHYVDFEWLADYFLAFGYANLKMGGLAVIVTIATLVTVLFSLTITKLSKPFFFLVPLILGLSVLFRFVAVRPVVLSWLFMAILLHILWINYHKLKFVLPPLFLLWANFHGSFVAGLLIYGAISLFQIRKTPRSWVLDFGLLGLSFAVTFLNPYGIVLWKEVLGIMSDSSLHSRITEWFPAFFYFDPPAIILGTLTTALVLRFRSVFGWSKIVVYFLFLFAAISTSRILPWLVVISIPFCSAGIELLYKESSQHVSGSARFQKVMNIFFILAILSYLSVMIPFFMGHNLNESDYYPKQAVSFLKNNLPTGQLFAPYNWGGYLIWKFPEKKTFIDGRAYPGWRLANPSHNESADIFTESERITSGQIDFEVERKKYGITTVLWYQKDKPTAFANFLNLFSWNKNNFDFAGALEKEGWGKIYEDDVAVIYQKT